MAIRIREVDGHTIAICAARSRAKAGDLYLDDNIHHALTTKFRLDFHSEGDMSRSGIEKNLEELMLKEENEKRLNRK